MNLSSAALGLSLFVAAAGLGLAAPVLPGIVEAAGGKGAAYGLLASVAAVAQLVFSPLWGAAADRLGRKPVLAVGLAGCSVALLLFAFARSLAALALARAAAGALTAAVLPAALAMAADRARGAAGEGGGGRAGGIARLMAAFSLGAVAGPGLGGLLGEASPRAPLFAGAAIAFGAFLFALAAVPESRARPLPGEASAGPAGEGAGPAPPAGPAGLPSIASLAPLLALMLASTFGTSCFQAVFGLDALRRFGMGPGLIGGLVTAIAAAAAAAQGLLSGPATRRLGEFRLARLSMAGGAAGFVAMAAAPSASWYFAACVAYVLAHALLRPSLQSLAAGRAGGAEGRALGWANAAQGLGSALGPLAAGPLLDLYAPAPYLLGAAVLTASAVAASAIPAPAAASPLASGLRAEN